MGRTALVRNRRACERHRAVRSPPPRRRSVGKGVSDASALTCSGSPSSPSCSASCSPAPPARPAPIAPDWRAALAVSAEDAVTTSAADSKRPPRGRRRSGGRRRRTPTRAIRTATGRRAVPPPTLVFEHDKALAVSLQTRLNGDGDPRARRGRRRPAPLGTADGRADARGHPAAGEHDRGPDGAREGGASSTRRRSLPGARASPSRSSQHFSQAADRLFDVLGRYGLSYDGTADRDGDGVPDVLELRAGSDPRLGDTDGDGLTDRFEILVAVLAHHPAKADTDGDGMSDAVEDLDGDGLSAAGEQLAGSNPLEPDTDGDDLRDGAEVQTHTDERDEGRHRRRRPRRRRRAPCRHRPARPGQRRRRHPRRRRHDDADGRRR